MSRKGKKYHPTSGFKSQTFKTLSFGPEMGKRDGIDWKMLISEYLYVGIFKQILVEINKKMLNVNCYSPQQEKKNICRKK